MWSARLSTWRSPHRFYTRRKKCVESYISLSFFKIIIPVHSKGISYQILQIRWHINERRNFSNFLSDHNDESFLYFSCCVIHTGANVCPGSRFPKLDHIQSLRSNHMHSSRRCSPRLLGVRFWAILRREDGHDVPDGASSERYATHAARIVRVLQSAIVRAPGMEQFHVRESSVNVTWRR